MITWNWFDDDDDDEDDNNNNNNNNNNQLAISNDKKQVGLSCKSLDLYSEGVKIEFLLVNWPSFPRVLIPEVLHANAVTAARYITTVSFLFIVNSLFTIIPSFDVL
jgi:hypothetical protein